MHRNTPAASRRASALLAAAIMTITAAPLAGCERVDPLQREMSRHFAASTLPVFEALEIDGRRLTFETSLWIDHIPGADAGEPRLSAVVRLLADDGAAPPSGVEVRRLALARADESWSSPLTIDRSAREQGDAPAYRPVSPGPAWDVGQYVDAAVLITLPSGEPHMLLARSRQIMATR